MVERKPTPPSREGKHGGFESRETGPDSTFRAPMGRALDVDGPGEGPQRREVFLLKESRCRFCRDKVERVDYKDVLTLEGLCRSRGRIIAGKRSGTCSRHQRMVKLAIKIPALLDGMDNRAERAYTGWPDRLYVVGTDGRVRYKSAAGPFGFSPSELEASLKATLESSDGRR